MSGTYYDNVSDFGSNTDIETLSGLPKAYLKHITYEITEIDENQMIATLVVSVPDITDTLPSLVDQIINENQGMEYEELLVVAKSEMEDAFSSDDLLRQNSTIQLSIQESEEDNYCYSTNNNGYTISFYSENGNTITSINYFNDH